MVFAYVSIQGWIIDPNMWSFFDDSHEVLVLCLHYTKIIYADCVTSDVMMATYGGWGLLMFLEPLSKCSGGFSYICHRCRNWDTENTQWFVCGWVREIGQEHWQMCRQVSMTLLPMCEGFSHLNGEVDDSDII